MTHEATGKAMLAKKFAVGFGIAILFPMMIHYGVRSFCPAPRWEDYAARPVFDKDPAKQEEMFREQEALEKKRRDAEKRFQKSLFTVTAPAGVIAIVLGTVSAVPAVGSGLMFGGIFCLIDGYINYWSELPDFLRFLSLLAALGVLVFVGYRKLR